MVGRPFLNPPFYEHIITTVDHDASSQGFSERNYARDESKKLVYSNYKQVTVIPLSTALPRGESTGLVCGVGTKG